MLRVFWIRSNINSMESNDKTLALFTSQFPYGKVSETFLETEIMFLSAFFSHIILFPLSKEADFSRELPLNARVDDCLNEVSFSPWKKLKSLIIHPRIVVKTLTSEIKSKGFTGVLRNRRALLDYLSQQLIYHTILGKKLTREMVVYDYWFVDSTLALTFLRQKNTISRLIVRGHGFDIYDERNDPYGVVFRNWKMKWVDRLVLISEYGKEYVQERIDPKYHHKLHVSRLGVRKNRSLANRKTDTKIVVSCANLHPFKNVDKIPLVLSHITAPLTWIHFGDGPEMKNILANAKQLPDNIHFELKGHIPNSEVIEFYRSNRVDLFLSFSVSEGLPVSMMEAQSSGIPILSYPIGGIPELVINGVTGSLMQEEMSLRECAEMVTQLLEHPLDKEILLSFFETHFDASQNYPNFIQLLCS